MAQCMIQPILRRTPRVFKSRRDFLRRIRMQMSAPAMAETQMGISTQLKLVPEPAAKVVNGNALGRRLGIWIQTTLFPALVGFTALLGVWSLIHLFSDDLPGPLDTAAKCIEFVRNNFWGDAN